MAEGTTVVVAEPADDADDSEVVSEPAATELAEAAVEIAEIEADRDVAIAEIVAEQQTETAEMLVDGIGERLERIEAWQEEHGPPNHPGIQQEMLLISTTLADLSTRLAALEVPNPPSEPEGDGASDAGEAGPPSSEPPPASEPNSEPEPEAPSEPVRRKVRWV